MTETTVSVPPKTIAPTGRTIARLWLDAAAEGRDGAGYLVEDEPGVWREVSWGEAARAVDELAHGLLSLGIRKGDAAMNKWVNAAIKYMKGRDEFAGILHANVPKRFWSTFDDNVPRKGKANFSYPVGKDLPSDCSGA